MSYDSTEKMDDLKGLSAQSGYLTPEEILSICDRHENVLEGILKGFSGFKTLGIFNSYIAILFLFFVPSWL